MSRFSFIATLSVIVGLADSTLFAQASPPARTGIRKPTIADTIRDNVYADNSFKLYINGELVAVDFDDSSWSRVKEYTEEEVGPKEPFYEHDFKGAKFIWSDDVKLDNVVLFRTVIQTPPDGKSRPDFRGLTDTVPASPRRGDRNSQRPRCSPETP
jgi:hypothetical protein